MTEKKDYKLLIILCLILGSIVGLLYFNNTKDIKTVEEPNYGLLKNYSKFFTINSCIYKYINVLSSDKPDELLELLDEDFKESNNINVDNVYKYVEKLNGNYTFKSKKIYYEKGNNKVVKYLVYGQLIEDNMDIIGEKRDLYLILKMDTVNQLFSVAPYDGKVFKEAK